MLSKAIEKIQEEIDKEKSAHVEVIGTCLIEHLNKHPKESEKVLMSNKNIAKSIDEVRKVAERRQVNNRSILMGEEVLDIVFKYYGIEIKYKVEKEAPISRETVKEDKNEIDFNVSIEDFI